MKLSEFVKAEYGKSISECTNEELYYALLTLTKQIERTVTGKDGKAAFTSDLPLGQYYVKEIEAPK